MTPEGHTLSAWITFSAYREGDVTIIQAQALERPSDPFDELAYMLWRQPDERLVLEARLWRTWRATSVSRSRSWRPKVCASIGTDNGASYATCATARRFARPGAR